MSTSKQTNTVFRNQKWRESSTRGATSPLDLGLAETLDAFFREFRNEPDARAVADRLLERLKQQQMAAKQETCPACGNKRKEKPR